jgi:hypothetical protein
MSAVWGWFRLARAVATMAVGAVVAGAAGYALLQDDRALPRIVRQLGQSFDAGFIAAGGLPSEVPSIRSIALALLLTGLLLCGCAGISLCNWFLDREGK